MTQKYPEFFDVFVDFYDVPNNAEFFKDGIRFIKIRNSYAVSEDGTNKYFPKSAIVILKHHIKKPEAKTTKDDVFLTSGCKLRVLSMKMALMGHKYKPVNNLIAEANDIYTFLKGINNELG